MSTPTCSFLPPLFIPPSLSLTKKEEENVEKAPKWGEREREHMFTEQNLRLVDCPFVKHRLWWPLIRPSSSHSFSSDALISPSAYQHAFPMWWASYAAPQCGLSVCPWIRAENSPDIGQKWWSFLLSWKDSTPTSLPLSFSFFFSSVLFSFVHSPLGFLQVFFFFLATPSCIFSQTIFPALFHSSCFLDC